MDTLAIGLSGQNIGEEGSHAPPPGWWKERANRGFCGKGQVRKGAPGENSGRGGKKLSHLFNHPRS